MKTITCTIVTEEESTLLPTGATIEGHMIMLKLNCEVSESEEDKLIRLARDIITMGTHDLHNGRLPALRT